MDLDCIRHTKLQAGTPQNEPSGPPEYYQPDHPGPHIDGILYRVSRRSTKGYPAVELAVQQNLAPGATIAEKLRNLDFGPGLRALAEGRYDGVPALECRVAGEPMAELRRSADIIRRLWAWARPQGLHLAASMSFQKSVAHFRASNIRLEAHVMDSTGAIVPRGIHCIQVRTGLEEET